MLFLNLLQYTLLLIIPVVQSYPLVIKKRDETINSVVVETSVVTVDGNTYTTKITSTSTITITAPDRTVYVTLDEDEPTNAPTSSTNVGTTSTSPVQTSEAQASTPNTSSTAAQTSQVVLSSSRPIPTSSQAISSSSSAPTRTTQDSFTSSTEGTPYFTATDDGTCYIYYAEDDETATYSDDAPYTTSTVYQVVATVTLTR
ncbi:BA75_00192T0 [Komagataella pastoris]|uniref:BA75_00192T0 n=1 Tax=Komagataella pastoris TaxID=4922 RepID=A0A1B2J6X6_PICPA|nr:BA75_00192T0 [Komagataella pastoris]